MVEPDLDVPVYSLQSPEALRELLDELVGWPEVRALDEALDATGNYRKAMEPFMTHIHPDVPFMVCCYVQLRARAIALRCQGGRGCRHTKHPLGWKTRKARQAAMASQVEAILIA